MADFTLVTHVFDTEDDVNLRQLGNHLTRHSGVVALLASAGPKSQLLFCRSEDAPGDMQALLKEAFQALGGGGGGGSATMAQGGGPGVDNGRLSQILANIQQKFQ
jgi:alanyl-tRNA synthetase